MYTLVITCKSCRRNIEVEGEEIPAFLTCPACKGEVDLPDHILSVGDKIKHYKIIKHAGHGANACVYKALDTDIERDVALKVIELKGEQAIQELERFNNEKRILAKFNHANIVSVYEAGQLDSTIYVVMTYIDGQTLKNNINFYGPLEEEIVLNIALKLADAMDYAYQNSGLIHRDIKPENIMIDKDYKPYLIDFGVSKISTDDDSFFEGTIVGTPHFMSPEQANDSKNASCHSDMYSLGCTLFYALTGEVPYDGNNYLSVIMGHQRRDIPDPSSINKTISTSTSALIKRLMAKKQEERFTSWSELHKHLKKIIDGKKLHTKNKLTQTIDSISRPKYRQKAIIIISSLIALEVIIASFLFITLINKIFKPEKTVKIEADQKQNKNKTVSNKDKDKGNSTSKGSSNAPAMKQINKEKIAVEKGLATYLDFEDFKGMRHTPDIGLGLWIVQGEKRLVKGIKGRGMFFNGFNKMTTKYFGEVDYNLDYSISLWVKSNKQNSTMLLQNIQDSEKRNGWFLMLNKNSVRFAMIADYEKGFVDEINAKAMVKDWMHIVITHQVEKEIIIYINSRKIKHAYINNKNNLISTNQSCEVGPLKELKNQEIVIDNIRFYDRLINIEEVRTIYRSEKPEKKHF